MSTIDIQAAMDAFFDDVSKVPISAESFDKEYRSEWPPVPLGTIHQNLMAVHYNKTKTLYHIVNDKIKDLQMFKDWQYLSQLFSNMEKGDVLLTASQMQRMNEIYKRWKE